MLNHEVSREPKEISTFQGSLRKTEKNHIHGNRKSVLTDVSPALKRVFGFHGAAKVVWREEHDDAAVPLQRLDFRRSGSFGAD